MRDPAPSSSTPRKEHDIDTVIDTLIVAAIAIPALFAALMEIRALRRIAWLKTRIGIV